MRVCGDHSSSLVLVVSTAGSSQCWTSGSQSNGEYHASTNVFDCLSVPCHVLDIFFIFSVSVGNYGAAAGSSQCSGCCHSGPG